MNELYDHCHRLTQEDVDMANKLVRHIEHTRNPLVPQVGDRVRYTTRYGDFHGNALIEAVREGGTPSICLCPYVPFVWRTAGGIGCAVSGGPLRSWRRRCNRAEACWGISAIGDIAASAATVQSDSAPRCRCGNTGKAIRFTAISRPRSGVRSAFIKTRNVGTVTFTAATAFRSGRRRSSGGFSPITKERYSRLPIRNPSSFGAIGTSRLTAREPLVPIAPNDDGFRIGSREYRSFVIGEKPPNSSSVRTKCSRCGKGHCPDVPVFMKDLYATSRS